MCGALSTQEATRAQITIGFLSDFVQNGWQFWLECLDKPGRGSFISRAMRDRVLSQALDVSLLLGDANDHFLDVVDELSQGFLPAFALCAVVRGAFEADAWACWLADPHLNDGQRMARALTIRADSLFEMRRLGLPPKSNLPPGMTSAGHYAKRIRRVIAAGRRSGLVPKTHKDGRVAFVDLPKVTPLLSTLLPTEVSRIRYRYKIKRLTLGERTYGELSARARATSWALLSNIASVRRIDKYRQFGQLNLDVLEFIRLLGVAVGLHDEVLKRLALWAGRQPAAWEEQRGAIPW